MTSLAASEKPPMYRRRESARWCWVVEEPGEGERAGVEEPLAGGPLKHGLDILDPAGDLAVHLQDGGLGRFQDAVQAADDREGEDALPVLGLLVVTAEQVRLRPFCAIEATSK